MKQRKQTIECDSYPTSVGWCPFAHHDDVIKWKHFRVTGPSWGESIGHWWIPLTKASDTESWYFLWSLIWVIFNNPRLNFIRSLAKQPLKLGKNELLQPLFRISSWNNDSSCMCTTFLHVEAFWCHAVQKRQTNFYRRFITAPEDKQMFRKTDNCYGRLIIVPEDVSITLTNCSGTLSLLLRYTSVTAA